MSKTRQDMMQGITGKLGIKDENGSEERQKGVGIILILSNETDGVFSFSFFFVSKKASYSLLPKRRLKEEIAWAVFFSPHTLLSRLL